MFDNYGHSQQQSPATPPPQKSLRFDKDYIATTPGILHCVQLLCNIVGFICIKVSFTAWVSAIFYNILYWVCNIITLTLLLSYMLHVVEKHDRWPWLKFEFLYCGVTVLVYVILSIVATTIGESAGYAAGFFGFCAVIAYTFDGYLKYKMWKRNQPAQ